MASPGGLRVISLGMNFRTLLLRSYCAVAVAAAVLALGACRSLPAAGGRPWKMALTMSPSPASSAGDTVFTLKVSDAAGRPVNGGTASLDLAMTSMDMGPNHVVLAPKGNGVYTGSGAFLMSGTWRCTVTFTAGGRTQTESLLEKVR